MCASGFNNWCCRMVTSQNYPAKLLCFQPSVVQVVNYKTWVVINLAPSPRSSETPTGTNSKKIHAGKIILSAAAVPERDSGRAQQPLWELEGH